MLKQPFATTPSWSESLGRFLEDSEVEALRPKAKHSSDWADRAQAERERALSTVVPVPVAEAAEDPTSPQLSAPEDPLLRSETRFMDSDFEAPSDSEHRARPVRRGTFYDTFT